MTHLINYILKPLLISPFCFLFFSFQAFAADPPELYYPANNSTGWYTDRSVRCYLVDGDTDPAHYIFQMDVVPTFDSPAFTQAVGTDYYSSPQHIRLANDDLLYGQTYYWRVMYDDGAGNSSAWSSVWNFTTLTGISNQYLSDNSTGHITDRSLRCNTEDFNTDYLNYEFEMDTVPTFDSPAYEFSAADGYNSSSDYV